MIEQHLESYLDELRVSDYSARTLEQYRHKLRQFDHWLNGRPITLAVLAQYRDTLLTEGRRPRTVRVTFTALFSFFAFLERAGHCSGLPHQGVLKLPRMDRPQRDVPTPAEMEALFDAARHRMRTRTLSQRFQRARTLAVLTVLDYAGVRRGELLALNVDDLQQVERGWILRVRRGKGGESRWIPLTPEAVPPLLDYLAVRKEWSLGRPPIAAVRNALWLVDRRRRLSEKGLTALWDELKALAGLEHRTFGPHGVRHRFASDLFARNKDAKTVQALLGHSSVVTTLTTYVHADPDRLWEAVESREAEPPPAPKNRPAESGRPAVSKSPAAPRDPRARWRTPAARNGRLGR